MKSENLVHVHAIWRSNKNWNTSKTPPRKMYKYIIEICKKKSCGDAGDWTPDLSHAKRTLYHWATSPTCKYTTFSAFKTCMCIYVDFLKFEFIESKTLKLIKYSRLILEVGIQSENAFHQAVEGHETDMLKHFHWIVSRCNHSLPLGLKQEEP